jgi:hypothetical protein
VGEGHPDGPHQGRLTPIPCQPAKTGLLPVEGDVTLTAHPAYVLVQGLQ